MMPLSDTNRRDFVKLGTAALAVAATSTARSASAASYAKIPGANDRVRTGIVGCGDRMLGGDVPAFVANQKAMNFELVAVSDIWKLAREKAAATVEKLAGSKVDMVRNNDELYARNDIDAVLIATADFQQARHGIDAVKAGRDAYVEKPTGHRCWHPAPLHARLHQGRRIHPVRQIRRHRHGGNDLECEPAGTLAPPRR